MGKLNLIKYIKMKEIDIFASYISILLRKSIILLINGVLNYENNSVLLFVADVTPYYIRNLIKQSRPFYKGGTFP